MMSMKIVEQIIISLYIKYSNHVNIGINKENKNKNKSYQIPFSSFL